MPSELFRDKKGAERTVGGADSDRRGTLRLPILFLRLWGAMGRARSPSELSVWVTAPREQAARPILFFAGTLAKKRPEKRMGGRRERARAPPAHRRPARRRTNRGHGGAPERTAHGHTDKKRRRAVHQPETHQPESKRKQTTFFGLFFARRDHVLRARRLRRRPRSSGAAVPEETHVLGGSGGVFWTDAARHFAPLPNRF